VGGTWGRGSSGWSLRHCQRDAVRPFLLGLTLAALGGQTLDPGSWSVRLCPPTHSAPVVVVPLRMASKQPAIPWSAETWVELRVPDVEAPQQAPVPVSIS
jgi:hypothetical protein